MRTCPAVPRLERCLRLIRLRLRFTGRGYYHGVDHRLLERIAAAPQLAALCLHTDGEAFGSTNDATLPHCEELEWMVESGGRGCGWDPAALLGSVPRLQRVDLRVCGAAEPDRAALAHCLRSGLLASVRELHLCVDGPPPPHTEAEVTECSLTQALSGCPLLETVTLALAEPSADAWAALTDLFRSGRCPLLHSVHIAEYS